MWHIKYAAACCALAAAAAASSACNLRWGINCDEQRTEKKTKIKDKLSRRA